MDETRNKESLPKVTIVFTPEEQKALDGEPGDLWKLYLVINRLRDFETNIAGIKTRISDRTFKEQLEIIKTPGRKEKKLDTSYLKRWLRRLEALGLIEQRGNYIFYCPLAYRPKSVKNRCYQGRTIGVTKNTENKNGLKRNGDKGFEDILNNEKNIGVTTGVTEVSPSSVEEQNIRKEKEYKKKEFLYSFSSKEKNVFEEIPLATSECAEHLGAQKAEGREPLSNNPPGETSGYVEILGAQKADERNQQLNNPPGETPGFDSELGNHKKNKLTDITLRFEEFWEVYPKKASKKRAREIWARDKLDAYANIIIADVLKRSEQHIAWLDGYIPHPTTYLNGELWNDEIDTRKPKQPNGPNGNGNRPRYVTFDDL